ncbi:type I-F CRISPR-associated protein Csy1 [Alcanivorax sp. MM125-6]|nr:type I-F CRISPR-associated protein Csy1 [Alcanivorax sp. MM125-6]
MVGIAEELRSLISSFLQERLEAKLEKLPDDDPKRAKLRDQFEMEAWLSDAARRVAQLQVVTHSLKPIHPDAKGASVYAPPESLPRHDLVGSHELPENFDGDVVGNAAALDVYKFLKLEYQGRSLLERALDNDRDLLAAFNDNPEQASEWLRAFADIVEPGEQLASHTHAKQLYWLAGDDPTNDGHFHLLAPLYATSLVHKFHGDVNRDRFGDGVKEARQARRERRYSETGYRDYPNLAVQKLGGTKPQNISQLNSERGGRNYLLASLPPRWVSSNIKPPLFVDSVFERFGRRRAVRETLRGLRALLRSDPAANQETRARRDEFLGALIDELVLFASGYSLLEPGWSASSDCLLVEAEALWLDPWRDDGDFAQRRESGEWAQEVRHRFASWLNKQLERELPVGQEEHRFWAQHLKQRFDALQEVLPYV